ncbi:dipeptide epimerase [Agrobacterium radiobacter]|uniref:dipeptide epimerase n=1 Tax=Agrobacterium radiobacter TaxID=362 RepID=UPI003F826363
MPDRSLSVERNSWRLKRPFSIARETFSEASTLSVEIRDGNHRGRGECLPSPYFGETPEGCIDEILGLENAINRGCDRQHLLTICKPGAARNAVDCALWDLEAKLTGVRPWISLGLRSYRPVNTCYSIGVGGAETILHDIGRHSVFRLFKLKADTSNFSEIERAILATGDRYKFIIDANGSWDIATLVSLMKSKALKNVLLVEQPFHPSEDAALAEIERSVPIFADESCFTSEDIPGLSGKYDGLNVKLDKAGGLTESLRMIRMAKAAGYQTMVGCRGGTSLGVAPAAIAAQYADYADLDQAMLIESDIRPSIEPAIGWIQEPPRDLWG